MNHDVERALRGAEAFLERQLGSRAAREASKRKVQRGMREVLRRVRRAALVFVGLLLALLVVDVIGAAVGWLWLLAIPIFLLMALISLFWPSRRPGENAPAPSAEVQELDLLASASEQWLLERCQALPRQALPALETILSRLHDLQPALAGVPAGSPVAGETQRLLGQHLPRLVGTYLDLPPAERVPDSESSRRFSESMTIVADELDRLCEEICNDRRLGFDTQTRFIETRYRGDEL